MAAVDRVRSISLFYACSGDTLYLSDDAEWVRAQLGEGQATEEVAETEFLLTGYVTGEDTLYSKVKQLQAGEVLKAHVEGGEIVVQKTRYYRYVHREGEWAAVNQVNVLPLLDRVVNCMERLVRWTNGRMIVIPLSGGYDSRLIATTLRRLGYENIIAFSYGRPGNTEAEISKWVAECLDIPWYFVPYSNEEWQKWFHSEERECYYRLAHNLSSLPHIQDWPAAKVLKEKGVIDSEAVIVPGHSGAFLQVVIFPTASLTDVS